jgi:hypothetical protein
MKEILERYQLHYYLNEFIDIDNIPSIEMPNFFKEEIKFALLNRGEEDKEAFTCEFIIVPFLRATWKKHPQLNLFSHVAIHADNTTIIPDYLVTAKNPTGYKSIYQPLLLTVEAKNEKFEEGWTQALLQSIICQKMNGTETIPIWSIVTTGDFWQFGKLEQRNFSRHPLPASIQDMAKLLGILEVLFSACEQTAQCL